MKGVILAGGFGTRLRPLTEVTNKHLLPVYNKPMIYYPIELLVKAGITDIVIVTGKEHAGNFLNLLGSGKKFGVRFYYVLQEGAGGIAEALGLAEGIVRDDCCTVVLGDNIVLDDVSNAIKNFKSGATVFLKEMPNPSEFGVPIFDKSGTIIRIEEKPANPKSNYIVTGLYIYDQTVFQKIKETKPSARGELEITDVNNLYIKEKRMNYVFLKEPWLDAGTIESLHESSKIIKQRLGK